MKQRFATRQWKRILSAGLSFAMAMTLLPSPTISAAPSDTTVPSEATGKVPTKDGTPIPDKAGSISMDQLENNTTKDNPFPTGTAGSEKFRIPALITMENGELLAIADARYGETMDGNGLDTITSVSNDGGKTWTYGFPLFFPDSHKDAYQKSTAFIDPGLLEGPDGTLYLIADAFPTTYSLQNVGSRSGTGYVEIEGKGLHLALTDNYNNVSTVPVDENDSRYLYYVDDFQDGYARILRREDNLPTDYAVDEWYNLYSVDENGEYKADLKQKQVNNAEKEIQQNVFYEGSEFHVFQTCYLWVITSKDHGRTWEHPKDIIPQVKTNEDQAFVVSPGRGLTTSDGRLVIGLYRYNGSAASQKASIMYSDDKGETWHRSENLTISGNFSSENEIVELEDGTLRMFFRNYSGKVSYADFTKNQAGEYDVNHNIVSLDACAVNSDCNLTAISYSKKINGKQAILLACPGGSGRTHGKIFTLLVETGNTMTLLHAFDVPNSADNYHYSSLTELQDGTIGLLWEDTGTSIRYDRFDISELIPDSATITGADGQSVAVKETVNVTIEKGKTYTKTVTLQDSGNAADLITTKPNKNVATAATETKTTLSSKVPVYAHVSNNSSIATAYNTAAATPTLQELTDLEFTFTKNGDNYQIKNEHKGNFLTFNQAENGGANYFSDTAADVSVDPQANGTVIMHCQYTKDSEKKTRYIALYQPNQHFNAGDSTTIANCVYDFTLWEQSTNAPSDSKLPGYQKITATANNLDGHSYLITAESDGEIFLLYPENGEHNQTKLLAVTGSDTPNIPNPVMSSKTECTISIMGVNEGFTKALIGGTEYRITVTDDNRETKTIHEPFDIPYFSTYDSTMEHATVTPTAGTEIVLHDSAASIVSNSLSSFVKEPNEELSIADAEFTFTAYNGDGDNTDKWIVQSGDKYLVHRDATDANGTSHVLFDSNSSNEPMKFVQTSGAATFRIIKPNGQNNGNDRYFIFATNKMAFDAMSAYSTSNSDCKYEFTLWKKDATVTDGLLPGYKRVTANEKITDGGAYLISYVFTENNNENILVLWPKDANMLEEGRNLTKIARLNSVLRITPTTTGLSDITIDGETYSYWFVSSSEGCAHSDTFIKGYREADCETNGYTGDTVCNTCGTVTKGETISAGHTWGAKTTIQALTETENGIYLETCANNAAHQKKTIVYASIYKKLKDFFAAEPSEISQTNAPLYKADDVTNLRTAYTTGKTLSDAPATITSNIAIYDTMDALNEVKKQLLNHREELEKELSKAVEEAKPIYDGDDQESYTGNTWTDFKDAYEAVPADNAIAQTTYDALQTIVQNLKAAYKAITNPEGGGDEDPVCTCEIGTLTVGPDNKDIMLVENETSQTLQLVPDAAKIGDCQIPEHGNDSTPKYYYNVKDAGDTGATVTETGLVTVTGAGKAVITVTAKLNEGTANEKTKEVDVEINVTIVDAETLLNNSITIDNVTYVITGADTASAQGAADAKTKKFKVNILSTVTINNASYKVTEITANGFKKFTKITQVTIGSNVTKIGNNAFNGYKALKTLKLSGKKAPKFGKKVFKGTPAKMTVKLSKQLKKAKNKKKVTRDLQKAGVSKKAKIK